jgi:DNA-binding MarR family transcriptional regulator/GNAT superfamily N-acetyltransferase
MNPALVEKVRRFSRTVTQRVGALDDRYLALNRPLGQARVLWEIGPDGVDLRALRTRLDLDSGYLSRLLRALEDDGLVRVGVSPADRRVRLARLTDTGLAERAELDRRSDRAAATLLGALTDSQRDRLVTAMAEVERLLVAASVHIGACDPRDPRARYCTQAYFAELAQRFEGGYDPAAAIQVSDAQLTPPHGVMLLATLHGEPVGCAVMRLHDGQPAHVKRMWVAPAVRGLGLSRRLLAEVERQALLHGVRTLRLETNRALTEAISLYRNSGFTEVERFNDEIYGDHFFEKELSDRGHE